MDSKSAAALTPSQTIGKAAQDGVPVRVECLIGTVASGEKLKPGGVYDVSANDARLLVNYERVRVAGEGAELHEPKKAEAAAAQTERLGDDPKKK